MHDQKPGVTPLDHADFKRTEAEATEQIKRLLAVKGKKMAVELHRELGHVMWEQVGMARSKQSLETAIAKIRGLRAEFWSSVNVTGTDADLNVALERANRVADFMEFGELLALDALQREESCGAHFRVEYQQKDETGQPNGECERDDDKFAHVAAWEYAGGEKQPVRNVEPLVFDVVMPTKRSYK